ncbi:MAG: ABC transporter permease [Alkalinema sp. RU_4_3]|nr:ABC transporter permease [Alkalinema sp. RU_4_3]
MYIHQKATKPFSRRQITYYRDLLWELVSREMKLLYKRSLLGVFWTLLNPLLQLLVFSTVFRLVLKTGQSIPNYLAYAFSGLLIWGWTQTSLFQATGLITGNRPLIRQPSFPTAILPIVTVTTGMIHFLLAFPALLIIMVIDKVQIGWPIVFLPLLWVLQFIFTLSFAYPLAALNVTFRDTQHTLGVILQLMFYMLPIFYAVGDGTIPPALAQLYHWNPLVVLLDAYRYVLIGGDRPSLIAMFGLSAVCLAILPIGYQIFKRQGAKFVEEV